MITPRIKPSAFWRRRPSTDLFVEGRRQAKLGDPPGFRGGWLA